MSAVDTVRTIYEHYRGGDTAGALALCSDDFCYDWRVHPKSARFAGRFSGVKQFEAKLGEIQQMFEYNSFTPLLLIGEGDHVAARVEMTLTHRRSGEQVTMEAGHFWTVRDGKATELVEYYDTALIAATDHAARSAA